MTFFWQHFKTRISPSQRLCFCVQGLALDNLMQAEVAVPSLQECSMVGGEELCQGTNVLSKVVKGSRGFFFTFHGVNVDEVLTLADLELHGSSQGFDVD